MERFVATVADVRTVKRVDFGRYPKAELP